MTRRESERKGNPNLVGFQDTISGNRRIESQIGVSNVAAKQEEPIRVSDTSWNIFLKIIGRRRRIRRSNDALQHLVAQGLIGRGGVR